MDSWDQRSLEFRRVLRTGIAVAIIVISLFLADEDRYAEGWLLVAGLAVCAIALAFWICQPYAGLSSLGAGRPVSR